MNLFLLTILAVVALANAQFGVPQRTPDIIQFMSRNRIPYWAKIQNTPLGPRFFWRRSADASVDAGVVSCSYINSTSTLKCNSSTDFVECKAIQKLEEYRFGRFGSFAVSAQPVGNMTVDPANVKYPLYPERPDKAGWKHSKIRDLLRNLTFDHSIYFSTNTTDNGYRVVDFSCWKNFITFLNGVSKPQTIKLGMKPGRVDDVKIIGKVKSNF